jgi:hypothetical protein
VDIPGASPADPGQSGSTAGRHGWRTQLPPTPSPGVLITGHRGGAGEKHRGGRAGDSRSPRERPRRSATEPAPAGRPRSPSASIAMLPYLSDQGQRTGTHSACSRCDSYMKGFQPTRRGAAPGCGTYGEQFPAGPHRAAHRPTWAPTRCWAHGPLPLPTAAAAGSEAASDQNPEPRSHESRGYEVDGRVFGAFPAVKPTVPADRGTVSRPPAVHHRPLPPGRKMAGVREREHRRPIPIDGAPLPGK